MEVDMMLRSSRYFFAMLSLSTLRLFLVNAENICDETPPANRVIDGIPAYAQCSTSTGSVYSNNGIDTRTTSGGSGWIRTQYSGGYQCTEFAFRYLTFRWNIRSAPNGNAGTWGDGNLPAGLVKTTTPIHGDLIIFAPGSCGAGATTGHVAIIDIVSDSTLTIVEQNGASRRKCKASCAKYFLHAEANNGIVPILAAPTTFTSTSDVSILVNKGRMEIQLSGDLVSGASVQIFNLRGQLMADLTDRSMNGRISFEPGYASPTPVVAAVRKGNRKVCRRVVVASR